MTHQYPKSKTTILEDPNSNFKIQDDEIYPLLSGNDLYKYREEEILIKINISKIKEWKILMNI